MFTPLPFAPIEDTNATISASARHNSEECSTAAPPAPAEQLGAVEESPPVQRLVEICTPVMLKPHRPK